MELSELQPFTGKELIGQKIIKAEASFSRKHEFQVADLYLTTEQNEIFLITSVDGCLFSAKLNKKV